MLLPSSSVKIIPVFDFFYFFTENICIKPKGFKPSSLNYDQAKELEYLSNRRNENFNVVFPN